MKIPYRVSYKKELLLCIKKRISHLRKTDGFILMDTVAIIPITFTLTIAILLMAGTFIKNFSEYVDTWIMQYETRKIFEDMIQEMEYADEIYYKSGTLNQRELRICSSRRATLISAEKLQGQYLSYKNSGAILYRQDLAKLNDYVYTVISKQPLNAENCFSNNKISFQCTKLAENLYLLEVEGYSYKTEKYFRLKTSVINRTAKK